MKKTSDIQLKLMPNIWRKFPGKLIKNSKIYQNLRPNNFNVKDSRKYKTKFLQLLITPMS